MNDPAVLERVSLLSPVTGGIFAVGDNDGGPGTTLAIGLVSLAEPIPAGPFAEILFDCTVPPPAEHFVCAADASTLSGVRVPVRCTVSIVPPPSSASEAFLAAPKSLVE
jgi:hypothetical protein